MSQKKNIKLLIVISQKETLGVLGGGGGGGGVSLKLNAIEIVFNVKGFLCQ